MDETEIIKKRKINVEGMTCEGCEKKIDEALSKINGIKQVKADKAGKVYLEYDLMKIKLKGIEEQIIKLGYKLPNKFLDRTKRGFIHDTEQNEYDNMNAPDTPCCSNPKEILSKNEKK